MSASGVEARASDTDTSSDGLAAYLVTVELRGADGERRRVGLVCAAGSGSSAVQIAYDVNDDALETCVVGVSKIVELQVIHPLSWDARKGLSRA